MSRIKNRNNLDKSSASPIRNLFKENKEAYNKYHEEKKSESKKELGEKPNFELKSDSQAVNNKTSAQLKYKDDYDTSDIYGEILSEKDSDTELYKTENGLSDELNSHSETASEKKGHFSKLKENLNKIINVIKQSPEANSYEDEAEDIFSVDNHNISAVKDIYKVDKSKKENTKTLDEAAKEVELTISENKLSVTSEASAVEKSEINKNNNDNKSEQKSENLKTEEKASANSNENFNNDESKPESGKSKTEENTAGDSVEDNKDNETKTDSKKIETKENISDDAGEKGKDNESESESEETETKEKLLTESDKNKKAANTESEKAEIKENISYEDDAGNTDKKTESEPQKPESNANEIEYNSENVIYTAPLSSNKKDLTLQDEKKEQKPSDQMQDIMPSVNKNERHKKELPVYDIFAEYAKEQEEKNKLKESRIKQSKDQKADMDSASDENSDVSLLEKRKESGKINAEKNINSQNGKQNGSEKTGTALKDIKHTDKKEVIDEQEQSHDKDDNEISKTDYKNNSSSSVESNNDSELPEAEKKTEEEISEPSKKSVSRYRADDLPGGDGIRIIPWQVPKTELKTKQNASENEDDKYTENDLSGAEADLTEGHISSITYHYSNTEPFIVMAGKFSKTLRGEYEAVMMHKHKDKIEKNKKDVTAESSERKSQKISKPLDYSLNGVDLEPVSLPSVQARNIKAKTVENSVKNSSLRAHAKQEEKQQYQPLKEIIQGESSSKLTEKNDKKQWFSQEKSKAIGKKIKKTDRLSDKKPFIKEKRKKFDFRQLFDGDEEYDPDDSPIEEIKPQLDDYTEEKDAEAINTEIATTFQTVFARTIILTGTTVASIVMSLIAQCTPLFRESIKNGWLWYAVISFLLFAVSVIVYRLPIVNGLMALKGFKGNPDTAPAVASVAVAVQSITALFTPNIFINGTMHIYVPLVLLALLLNSIGKLLILMRTHRNFSFLRKPYPKFAGKIYTDVKNAQKMVEELPSKKTIIAYTKRAKFMSNFLQLSYLPDPSEDTASKAAPITTLISLISCIAYGVLSRSFAGAVSSFALTACVSVPIICLLAINIPLKRLCASVLKSGAMITSYETVKQFCDTNAIMVDSSQLYPKGSITLSGMKAFKQSKLNDAILAGAAIMYAVNGNMTYVFENIVQCRREALPDVENVIYEDGKGLVGWVRGQRVLIGNRELLESHNIKAPNLELEERYIKTGNDITYISVSGELIAMFILSYKTDRTIARELRNLEQNGVSLIVRTVDANITKEKVAERFGLFHRCISIMPTGLGNIYHEVIKDADEKSRAYLVTRGKLSSFAKAVSGCIKLKSNATITKILQYIAVALGLALVTLISFVSGFQKLGCLEMLIYIGFWIITSLFVSIIRK